MPIETRTVEDVMLGVSAVMSLKYEGDADFEIEEPFFLLFTEDSLVTGPGGPEFPVLGMSDVEVARTKLGMRILADAVSAEKFAFVSEGWVVQRDLSQISAEEMRTLRASQEPDRKEVLWIFAGDRSGKRMFRQWELVRDSERKFVSMNPIDQSEDGEYETRWDIWKS